MIENKVVFKKRRASGLAASVEEEEFAVRILKSVIGKQRSGSVDWVEWKCTGRKVTLQDWVCGWVTVCGVICEGGVAWH